MTQNTNAIDRFHGRARRASMLFAALASAVVAVTPAAHAQRAGRPEALRGSMASVEKMYSFARRHRIPFYLTPFTLDAAIARGKLVPLTGDENYELARGVGFSYATVETRQFVTQFAPQYLAVCGMPLTVTSAARPSSRQPRNSSPHSVHPTGIAVDFRRPYAGPCLTWVRHALTQLESRGVVEATEERHPAHLHIAVLKAPGARFTLPDLTNGVVVARQPAAAEAMVTVTASDDARPVPAVPDSQRPARFHRVRKGDTLWGVAKQAGVSVKALAATNQRSVSSVLLPGTMLLLPEPTVR